MASSNTFGRRTLLKRGGAAALGASFLPASVFGRAAAAEAAVAQQPALSPGTPVYRSEWVPPGAAARVAFVTDHHYWPNHPENWGGGAQITSSTERRMPDLADLLNAARPDVSIHGGDVISAGGAFFPPLSEFEKQDAFRADFIGRLTHPAIPMIGNHETHEAPYRSHDQLASWTARFGSPFQKHALPGWRMLTLNSMTPNGDRRYGQGDAYGNVYGIDPPQIEWLRRNLAEAAASQEHVLLFAHVPPSDWGDRSALEELVAANPSVKGMVCGHWHRNNLSFLAGVPVLVRASNVETPFSYHMLHLYRDGRVVVVQHSQHFPFDEFVSAGFAAGKQGAESDRYLTIGGNSLMPIEKLTVVGDDVAARVADGHLRLSSRLGRAGVVIDTADLRDARLTMSMVMASGDAAGGFALAGANGRGGVEAVVTPRYSASGKVYLRQDVAGGAPSLLQPAWFNIGYNLAYRLTLEVRGRKVTASWKGMTPIDATVETDRPGRFGCFVERGVLFVTDLALERLV